ncbi:hypothetical protein CALVIDRAFT_273005 [Calocera viscosa TUFC12733]|uniref:Uncharacterized protein n=1 Tax=Calocera viscosa (strain TUFC12733) TaxID=1330018 RepID=A0A167QY29_CALVF|nr:hypothetical protein CALVIDRAFT_273005 [Calocera viscosa TUFC12733]
MSPSLPLQQRISATSVVHGQPCPSPDSPCAPFAADHRMAISHPRRGRHAHLTASQKGGPDGQGNFHAHARLNGRAVSGGMKRRTRLVTLHPPILPLASQGKSPPPRHMHPGRAHLPLLSRSQEHLFHAAACRPLSPVIDLCPIPPAPSPCRLLPIPPGAHPYLTEPSQRAVDAARWCMNARDSGSRRGSPSVGLSPFGNTYHPALTLPQSPRLPALGAPSVVASTSVNDQPSPSNPSFPSAIPTITQSEHSVLVIAHQHPTHFAGIPSCQAARSDPTV